MIIRKRFNILFLIGVFIILYQPPILPFNSIHLVGLISLAVLALKRGRLSIDFRKDDALLFFIFVALYILVFCIVINRAAISAIAFPLYFIIDIIPFSLVTKDYMEKQNLGLEDLIRLFIAAGMLQGITALLAFVFPSVQSFFIDRIMNYGYSSTLERLTSFRMYGFSPYLTFGTPVIQTVLAVLCFVGMSKTKAIDVIMGFVLFFTAIINSRLSLIVLIVGVAVYFIFRGGNVKKKIKAVFIILLAVFTFFLIVVPFIKQNSPSTYEWLIQGMEELNIFFNSQGADNYSYYTYFTNASTYRLPDSVFEFLFGSGSYVMTSTNIYGVRSDVGFINDIWFGGIVYSVFIYLGFFKILRKLIQSDDSLLSYIGKYCLILFPVLNIKGIAFTMFSLSNFLIIVYICSNNEQRGSQYGERALNINSNSIV